MYSYAAISNGIVVNMVSWDGISQYQPKHIDELVKVDSMVHLGSSYDGATFTAPESEPYPMSFMWDGEKWEAVYPEVEHREAPPEEPDYEVE